MTAIALALAASALAAALFGVALRVRAGRHAVTAPASGVQASWWGLQVVGSWPEGDRRDSRLYVDESSGPQPTDTATVTFEQELDEGIFDDLKEGQTLKFGGYTFQNPPLSKADRFVCTEKTLPVQGGRTAFVVAGGLTLLSTGLALAPTTTPPHARVALVGIDGGDWSVLDPLIAAGEMPNLGRIRNEGATAPLVISSAQSPDSWTTLASGHLPEVHGVSQDGATMVGGTFAATPNQVKVMRLWDMAGDQGKRVFVTNYWVTGPAYAIPGVMVPREPGEAYPPGADKRLEDWAPTTQTEDIQRLGLGVAKSGTTSWWLSQEPVFDLIILPYYGHDQGLHQLWQEFDLVRSGGVESLTPEQQAQVRTGHAVILETARLADRMLGAAMEYVGEDGYIVLVSDHGHTAASPPTRRIAISREVLDGKRGTLENGTLQAGRVTINLVAQERGLPPNAGGLRYALRYPLIELTGDDDGAVRARLLALTAESGEPVFRESGDRIAPADAVFKAASTALGRHEEDHFSVYVNSGSHSIDEHGIFGVFGPGVTPGPIEGEVRSLDATPTVLWLMGLPIGEDQTGRPITAALANPREVTSIPTYETGRRPWANSNTPGGLSPDEEEWLKSLGYL